MTATEPKPVHALQSAARARTRAGDRREGLTRLLAHLVAGLGDGSDRTPLRTRLEEGLRKLIPVRVLEIREGSGAFLPRRVPAAPESIALEVPGISIRGRAVLEAAFDPASRLDDWDVQTLNNATYLTALVLELDRLRGWGVQAPARRAAREGAAPPLIGSSVQMRVLRERIERVAATDFTVLIEGAIGP